MNLTYIKGIHIIPTDKIHNVVCNKNRKYGSNSMWLDAVLRWEELLLDVSIGTNKNLYFHIVRTSAKRDVFPDFKFVVLPAWVLTELLTVFANAALVFYLWSAECIYQNNRICSAEFLQMTPTGFSTLITLSRWSPGNVVCHCVATVTKACCTAVSQRQLGCESSYMCVVTRPWNWRFTYWGIVIKSPIKDG